jgi:hypothetical protein
MTGLIAGNIRTLWEEYVQLIAISVYKSHSWNTVFGSLSNQRLSSKSGFYNRNRNELWIS